MSTLKVSKKGPEKGEKNVAIKKARKKSVATSENRLEP